MAKSKSSARGAGYLHGYSAREQDRLYRQARFLEPWVYAGIDFANQESIVEVGCGVGAQTEILLERFPKLRITGVDASAEQLKRARQHLKTPLKNGRVALKLTDAAHMDFAEGSFDGAFLCWFLEHVKDPLKILRDTRRVLKRRGVIYCTEVMNASFYLHPYSPATLKYWFEFNDHQWTLQGDPFLGGKLANLLLAAGYQNVECKPVVWHLDSRAPKSRLEAIDYTEELLLSGAPGLLKAKRVTPRLVEAMKEEFERVREDPDAVIFYAFIQARAEAL